MFVPMHPPQSHERGQKDVEKQKKRGKKKKKVR